MEREDELSLLRRFRASPCAVLATHAKAVGKGGWHGEQQRADKKGDLSLLDAERLTLSFDEIGNHAWAFARLLDLLDLLVAAADHVVGRVGHLSTRQMHAPPWTQMRARLTCLRSSVRLRGRVRARVQLRARECECARARA
eukprot:6172958-Pleurochrysis_carterae.AAC.1